MSKQMTHTGEVRNTMSSGVRRIRLRETAHHWVDEAGTKWRKKGGSPVGVHWPVEYLKPSTVEPIEENP